MSQRNELINAYITTALKHRNRHTKRMMSRAARLIIERDIPLSNDLLADVYAILSADEKRRYSHKTKAYYITCIRQFMKWLDATDRIPSDLSLTKMDAKYKAMKGNERHGYKPKVCDPNIAKLRTYYDEQPLPTSRARRIEMLRARAIVHVLFSTACRVSECLSLNRADVANGAITEPVITGKGDKSRVVFLDEQAIAAIRAYLATRTDKCPALFINASLTRPARLGPLRLYRIIKTAAAALGLSPNTSPHMIRHYVATDMMNNHDVPLEVVQRILGHASPATTETVYAHSRMKQVRRHIERYRAERKYAENTPADTMPTP